MTIDVIQTMQKHKNICKYIHLPVQSEYNRILKSMNRGYTREEYIILIDKIKRKCQLCCNINGYDNWILW